MNEPVPNPSPPISYVMSRRARVVHKRLGGMSFEQCNLDAISPSDKQEADDLAELQRQFGSPLNPFRPCRRCFKGGEFSDTVLLLRQLSGLAS